MNTDHKRAISIGITKAYKEGRKIPYQPNPKLPVPPKKELEVLYWEQKLSTRAIAVIYGVGMRKVREWMIDLDIPRRTYKDNPTPTKKGSKITEAHRLAISNASIGKAPANFGEKHWNYQGGITPINKQIRNSAEYKAWRTAVFTRDNYTCQICGKSKCYVEADHIKPFSKFPELRFEVNNGRTLCKDCHQQHGWQFFKDANPRKRLPLA